MDTTEIRTTNETTGGQKGVKLQRFGSMPAKVLLELAEHYGKGVRKYPNTGLGPNYTRGYDWSLSYEAAMRHLTQFWAGENLDPETGSKHVIAAAWHCLALALFMETHPELDNRWEKVTEQLQTTNVTDKLHGVESYCLKCKKTKVLVDPQTITMKNGRDATVGSCPDCGTKIYKIK